MFYITLVILLLQCICVIYILQVKSFVLFVTHYPLLSELEGQYPQSVANFHMAYVEVEDTSKSTFSCIMYTGIGFVQRSVHVAVRWNFHVQINFDAEKFMRCYYLFVLTAFR